MSRRSSFAARALAGLAVIAAAVAVIWVVSSSLGGEESQRPEGDRKVTASGCNPQAENALKLGFYVIKQDEFLGLIAERTCLEEEELLRLNPDLDPQALSPGACLSLEKGGCERREE